MSRTYKDRPYKLTKEVSYEDEYLEVEYEANEYVWQRNNEYSYGYTKVLTGKVVLRTFQVKKPGLYTKKKRSYTHKDYWWYKGTPSWWNHQWHTVPKRAKCRNWEKDTVKLLDIEDATDCPDYGNKPHQYYW